jgi:TRAP-type C4-dicarboxylate transport system substrate-binding protein
MMLTSHIMNAQLIVINEKSWQALSPAQRDQVSKAADEVRRKATDMVASDESAELEKLKVLKMNVIGPANGLKLDLFKASVNKVVQEKFGTKFGDLYRDIAAVK